MPQKTPIRKGVMEAIRAQLPEEIGVTLRARLKEADETLDENIRLLKMVSKLQDSEEKTASLNKREKLLGEATADLENLTGEYAKKMEALNTFRLECELAAEKHISAAMMAALAGLVRNTQFNSSVFGSIPGENGLIHNTSETKTDEAM